MSCLLLHQMVTLLLLLQVLKQGFLLLLDILQVSQVHLILLLLLLLSLLLLVIAITA